MIQRLKKLIVYLLTRDLGANPIAIGACYGLALGLIPRGTPQWIFFFFFAFLIRVNLLVTFGTFFIAWLMFLPLMPTLHAVGLYLLVEVPMLQPLWKTLYNAPFITYLQLNNTIVLASTLLLAVLVFPFFTFARWVVFRFHVSIREFILRSYFWRSLHTQHFERLGPPKA